jgi:hypothetical protein
MVVKNFWIKLLGIHKKRKPSLKYKRIFTHQVDQRVKKKPGDKTDNLTYLFFCKVSFFLLLTKKKTLKKLELTGIQLELTGVQTQSSQSLQLLNKFINQT